MKAKTKGRILAVIQFVILVIIFAHAFTERTRHQYEYSAVIYIISLVLIAVGIISVIFTLIEFKQIMTPNPVPLDNQQLRTGGIYSLVRHPMYFSVILLLTGGALYLQAYFTLIFVFIAVIFLIYKIRFEERMLLEKFPSYKEYQTKTKRLFPFIY